MPEHDPPATSPPHAGAVIRAQHWFAGQYDRILRPSAVHRIELVMIYLAVLGFAVHMVLIWLSEALPALAPLRRLVGTNLLSSIYTPFSFILFYEVLLLVVSIPESTTLALGRQFEVISLIIIRNVFKDLAEFQSLSKIETQLEPLSNVLMDMGGGLVLFLLVGAFYQVSRWRTPQEQALGAPSAALNFFIVRKKVVALFLSILFIVLFVSSAWLWAGDAYQAVVSGTPPPPTLTTIFYTSLFSVIIFTDVLLLLLSLLLSDSYQLVFRNAGFVAATILLRISIAAARPYNLLVAIAAVVFGILVMVIYKYCSRVGMSHDLPHH
jgi:hypothetical protein